MSWEMSVISQTVGSKGGDQTQPSPLTPIIGNEKTVMTSCWLEAPGFTALQGWLV